MDDVLAAGTKLKWTEELVTFDEIEQKFGLPQIVKLSQNTSTDYNLPEAEPVLLLSKRNPVRLIAQTIEEGHYVMGKQVEIPNEYSGLFKISNDFERDEAPLMTFRSIQEVADAFPSKVYIQEQLTVTLANDDLTGKFSTVVLQKGDELTVVNKAESHAVQGTLSKPASRFKSKVRRSQHNLLIVHCTRLNESLSLPLSIQGWFATRPPVLVNLMERNGVISLQQIMEQANLPLTVTVSTNSTRSVKDEFVLRSGMHLKLIGLEEHDILLAVTPFQRIIELSVQDVTFMLPSVLTMLPTENNKEQMTELTQYQTYVQSAYMNSKLQNSPSNIDEYCTSVRFHIPRNIRPTKPKPLNSNASLRSLVLNPIHQKKRMNIGGNTQGLSAIQLLSNQQQENSIQRNGRGSRRGTSSRRQLPVPGLPVGPALNPPLPPRNSPTSPHISAFAASPNNYDPSHQSAPPVPPKFRVPPPPPSLPTSRAVPYLPADMPTRPAPTPNVPDVAPELSAALSQLTVDTEHEDHSLSDGEDPCAEEDIWEEFQPPTNLQSAVRILRTGSDSTKAQEEKVDSPTEQAEELPEPANPAATNEELPLPRFISEELSARSDSPCFTLASSKGPTATSDVSSPASEPFDTVVLTPEEPSRYEKVVLDSELEATAPTAQSFANEPSRMVEVNGIGDGDVMPKVVGFDCDTVPAHTSFVDRRNEPAANDVVSSTIPHDGLSLRSNASEEEWSLKHRFKTPTKHYVLPPTDWFPPRDVESLTVDEVTSSLRFIGISEDVVRMFDNERVDGSLLVELSEEILEQDFSLSKLYRFKIKRFIEGWRPRLSLPKTSVLYV